MINVPKWTHSAILYLIPILVFELRIKTNLCYLWKLANNFKLKKKKYQILKKDAHEDEGIKERGGWSCLVYFKFLVFLLLMLWI